ncbi:MAG: molybdopterin-binding protein [Tetragenococcus halophilus]|nr:molybdopterin-binding protein [Tetragenococcus halophilus]MDN6152790.1 molybdopterin-binding protein [Tetragenococcus halophilus]MDN6185854.1 molybdopterin-binding protein [Tetragenococcus halophilus]MDN6607595.1 molybdopterin-binding protein [Tetragenococcus halophilus]MDN6727225.1 molybdopterin-binding protein [Tetragenococcus halophilus]
MKIIAVEDAVGMTLWQDMTQIIPKEKKGPRFRKGHVITKEDVAILLNMGKAHIYVGEKQVGMIHEEEAAQYLFQMCNSEHLAPSEIKEGKIEAIAEKQGVLTVDQKRLEMVNATGKTMIATKPNFYSLEKGEVAAGMRIIPLVMEENKLKDLKQKIGKKPLLQLHPFTFKKIGMITTGSEVYHQRIKDGFEPVLRKKITPFPAEIIATKIVDDQLEMIEQAIKEMKNKGCDIILCTGGMSVDADDLTPTAIQNASEQFICYGTPVLPGSMFALSYLDNGVAVMGLPGAVMFSAKTVFDLILPRVMADIKLSFTDIASLGCGGLL